MRWASGQYLQAEYDLTVPYSLRHIRADVHCFSMLLTLSGRDLLCQGAVCMCEPIT